MKFQDTVRQSFYPVRLFPIYNWSFPTCYYLVIIAWAPLEAASKVRLANLEEQV